MKLFPRLPEQAGRRDLSPEEKSELWHRIYRESPLSVFLLMVSMVVSFYFALSEARGPLEIRQHLGSAGVLAFVALVMGCWAFAASWLTVRYLYMPRLERALERIR